MNQPIPALHARLMYQPIPALRQTHQVAKFLVPDWGYRWLHHRVVVPSRLGCPRNEKKNFGSNRNKICFAFVSVCFVKPKKKFFGCFGVSNLYRNNRNKQSCFETNQNNPEFSEKYLNIIQGGSDISGTISNLSRCIKKSTFY
jgi:hypothetical protein